MPQRSRWREADVLLRLLASALWPSLSIEACLQQWSDFQSDLAERKRNRVPRIDELLS
jgi:hypothetical protein